MKISRKKIFVTVILIVLIIIWTYITRHSLCPEYINHMPWIVSWDYWVVSPWDYWVYGKYGSIGQFFTQNEKVPVEEISTLCIGITHYIY